MTNPTEKERSNLKRKAPLESSSGSAITTSTPPAKKLHLLPAPEGADANPPAPDTEIIPVEFSRLVGQPNPEFAQSMRDAEELGYSRPTANRLLDARTYVLAPDVLRARFRDVLTSALSLIYREHGSMTAITAAATAATDATLTADACMAAIYARLRAIHKSFGIHPLRFNTHPTFPKECELPLPFAIAIENIGMFDTEDVIIKVRVVPSFPENTLNEGRSAATWNLSQYYSMTAKMKELKIPFRKVNAMSKTGSPWWTFKPIYNHGRYDLQCIFPPMMYTGLSATLHAMFLSHDEQDEAVTIYTPLADDVEHPLRARDLAPRDKRKSFFALCNLPSHYWNSATPH